MAERDYRAVFIDEVVFKPYSVTQRAWASRKENQHMMKEGIRLRTLYAVVAMSAEHGIEGLEISFDPIVKENVITLFKRLGRSFPSSRVVVFWDNLRMHYTREVVA